MLSGSALETAMAASEDGRFLMVHCSPGVLGAVGNPKDNTVERTIVRIDALGNVDTSTVFLVTLGDNLGTVASLNGVNMYVNGRGGASNGVQFVPFGHPRAAPIQVSGSSNTNSVGFGNGFLLANRRSSTAASNQINRLYSTAALPVAPGTVSLTSTANMLTGLAQGIVLVYGFVFTSATQAFVTSADTVVGGLYKYTGSSMTAGTWTLVGGYPLRSVTVQSPAGPVTANAFRNLIQYNDVSQSPERKVLFMTTGSVPGNNAILKFDTFTETWVFVAAAANAFSDLRAVALAPVAPTSSPSASPSSGAEPSASRTNTASPSATKTPVSASPVPTSTPQLCSQPAPAQPFSGNSVVALRVGSGTRAQVVTAREAFLDEIDITTGAVRQSIALPVGFPGGCMISTGTAEGTIQRTLDGFHVVIPCWSVDPAIVAGVGSGNTKTIGRVDFMGYADTLGSWIDSQTSQRGIAAPTASFNSPIYVSSGTNNGITVVTCTEGRTCTSTGLNLPGVSGYSCRGCTFSPSGDLFVSTSTLGVNRVNSLGSSLGYTQLMEVDSAATATAPAYSNVGSIVFENANTMYTADLSGTTSLNTITKYTYDGASWVLAPNYPKPWPVVSWQGQNILVSGARGLTGVSIEGDFTLFFSTALNATQPGLGNFLVKFSTTSETFTALARSCSLTDWRGIAPAPRPASPTQTPAPDVSPSATPPITETPTTTATVTPPNTPSRSASPVPTPSNLPTPLLCSASVVDNAVGSPPTTGNAIVLRIGSGTSPVGAAGAREAFLDEINLASGAVVQSWALPTGASGGCVIGSSPTEGSIARSVEGGHILVPCWQSAPTTVTLTNAFNKAAYGLTRAGTLSMLSSWTDGTTNFRSIQWEGPPAANLITCGSNGARLTAVGMAGTASMNSFLSEMGSVRGTTIFNGQLYGVATAAPFYFQVNDLTTFSQVATAMPGMPTAIANPQSLVFSPDGMKLWVGEFAGASTLTQYENDGAGSWSLSSGWPIANFSVTLPAGATGPSTLSSARSLTGYTNAAGDFVLLFTTFFPSGQSEVRNWLASYNTASGAFSLIRQACTWTDFRSVAMAPIPPSWTGTASSTQSGTPSSSATRSGTGSASPTRSSSSTGTASGTSTPSSSSTRSSSPTPTTSSTGTPSSSQSRTSTATPSPSQTFTLTPSPTLSSSPTSSSTSTQPLCRYPVNRVAVQSGVGGTFPVASAADAGNAGMYTSGSCTVGYKTFVPGPRLVYRISISDALPLGGVLTLSTCGLTKNNTVLYLGMGCPTWFGSFNCVRANDDVGGGAVCLGNPLASTLSHVATSRIYFVQLGSSSGTGVVSGLSWSYSVASTSPTVTRTRSRTASPTRTRSVTRSRSRSRKAKRAAA